MNSDDDVELGDNKEFNLKAVHIAATVCHFLLAAWTLTEYVILGTDWSIPVTTSYLTWAKRDESFGCGDAVTGTGTVNGTGTVYGTGTGNCFVRRENKVFDNFRDISLTELVIAFHVLSFVWQAIVLIFPTAWKYYYAQVIEGRNSFRWLEYSLSAPLMTIVIAVLLGQIDVVVLYLLAVCTWVLMGLGYLQETQRIVVREVKENVSSTTRSLVPHRLGWGLFFFQWLSLGFSFYLSLSLSEAKPPSRILPIVYSVYFIMLTLYASFGVVQAIHMKWGMNVSVELAYTVLSLVSKTTLGVLLYLGIRARDGLNLGIE